MDSTTYCRDQGSIFDVSHILGITLSGKDAIPFIESLICSDIGTIVFGITAAAAPKPEKWIFFSCGVLYGISTWTNAFLVYRNAYQHIQDNCKSVLLLNAVVFFGSWSCFPLLFLLGPEGNGVLTHTGSIIGHCIVDLLSKNLWGFLAWYLDYKMIRVERKEMYSEALTLKIEESQSVAHASFTGGSDPNGDNVTIAMLMVDNSGTNEIAEKLQNIFEKIRLILRLERGAAGAITKYVDLTNARPADTLRVLDVSLIMVRSARFTPSGKWISFGG